MKDVTDMTIKEALARSKGREVFVRIAPYDLEGLAECIDLAAKMRDAQARAGREMAAPFKASDPVEVLVGAAIIVARREKSESLVTWIDMAERAEARAEEAA